VPAREVAAVSEAHHHSFIMVEKWIPEKSVMNPFL
jgi:hypothetical protein